MRDIAQRTGLGLATISKYLNGGTVREKNRIAIERAIQELDFTVNEFARGLKTRRSRTIGIVIPELSSQFATSIIMVLEDELRRSGYGVLVCDSRSDPEREQEAIAFLLGKMADGIVLVSVAPDGHTIQPMKERNTPLVLLDREVDTAADYADVVRTDSRAGAMEATKCLIENGHRKIGILVGPEEIDTSRERLQGYQMAHREAGIACLPQLTENGRYTIEGGYQAMRRLWERCPEMTAVFATNYEMTLGAVLALGELGISIREDLSVIGFDNMDLARVVRPRLTVVSQPLEALGRQVAELLLQRLEKGRKETCRISLPTQLLTGDSVGAAGRNKAGKRK